MSEWEVRVRVGERVGGACASGKTEFEPVISVAYHAYWFMLHLL